MVVPQLDGAGHGGGPTGAHQVGEHLGSQERGQRCIHAPSWRRQFAPNHGGVVDVVEKSTRMTLRFEFVMLEIHQGRTAWEYAIRL